ncbi:hypothetical protein TNCV_2887741 [Trichonephila clavipes]|nr:hypothetical protein TNCV_2887741 [Trichonephila clavipes]
MMTPELAPLSPNYHTKPTGGRLSSQQINAHCSPTWRVFGGTRLELVTCQPRSDTLTLDSEKPRRKVKNVPS